MLLVKPFGKLVIWTNWPVLGNADYCFLMNLASLRTRRYKRVGCRSVKRGRGRRFHLAST